MKDCKFWSTGTTKLIGATEYLVTALRVHLGKFTFNFEDRMDDEMTDYLKGAFEKIDMLERMLRTAREFSEIGEVE